MPYPIPMLQPEQKYLRPHNLNTQRPENHPACVVGHRVNQTTPMRKQE